MALPASSTKHRALILYGLPGIGKSTIASLLCRLLGADQKPILAAWHFCRHTDEARRVGGLWRNYGITIPGALSMIVIVFALLLYQRLVGLSMRVCAVAHLDLDLHLILILTGAINTMAGYRCVYRVGVFLCKRHC